MLLAHNHNYIVVNKDGLSVYSLGSKQKQVIVDDYGFSNVLHSLESCNYLKLEKYNNLVFYCSNKERQEIAVEQEYKEDYADKSSFHTRFEQIYKVKLWRARLREIMLIFSLYVTRTMSQLFEII